MMQSNWLIKITKIMLPITKKFITLKSLMLILLLFVTGAHYSSTSIAQTITKTIIIEPKFVYQIMTGPVGIDFNSPE